MKVCHLHALDQFGHRRDIIYVSLKFLASNCQDYMYWPSKVIATFRDAVLVADKLPVIVLGFRGFTTTDSSCHPTQKGTDTCNEHPPYMLLNVRWRRSLLI